MDIMRGKHDATFKDKVTLEAVKGEKTLAQFSSEFRPTKRLSLVIGH